MTITDGATVTATANRNWLQWFTSRDSAITINKKNQEQLFKIFDATVDSDELINNMEQHDESIFLHKVNFGTNKFTLVHHFTTSGGALYDNGEKKFGFIQGLVGDEITMMTPDMTEFKAIPSNTDTAVPSIANLLNVKTEEDVTNLTVSATVKYRARNMIPVPPFLLEATHKVTVEEAGNAKLMLIKAAETIKEFDTAHNNDDEYVDKAKTKCKDLLYWLYLVGIDSPAITPVNSIVCGNARLKTKIKEKTSQCIENSPTPHPSTTTITSQVEASLKRPFEVLAATSCSTNDFMEKLTQLQATNNEKSTKTFKKIPAKYQQMILVAASTREVTEVVYNADAVEFFKCSAPLHAQVMLNSLLEAEGIECSVSTAMATTLLYGSFLWRNALSPAGLAASVLTSEGIIRNDTLQEGMVLDFATKFDMSEVSLAKLTKTQVLFPKDVEELTHRVRGLYTLVTFFLQQTWLPQPGDETSCEIMP